MLCDLFHTGDVVFCLAAKGELVIFPRTQPLPAGVVPVPGHHGGSGERSSLCWKGLEPVLDSRSHTVFDFHLPMRKVGALLCTAALCRNGFSYSNTPQ